MMGRSKSRHMEKICHFYKKNGHIRAYYYFLKNKRMVVAIDRGKQPENIIEANVVEDGQSE